MSAAIDTQDIDYQIRVMRAYKAGKEVQCRVRGLRLQWVDLGPHWNWAACEYRVKPPAKRTRPKKSLKGGTQ